MNNLIGKTKRFKGKFQLVSSGSINAVINYLSLPEDFKFNLDGITGNSQITGKKKIMVDLNEYGQWVKDNLFRIKNGCMFKTNGK